MSDVLSEAAVEDRAWLTRFGREVASEGIGSRFLWPDTIGGPGVPCTCTGIEKAERLNADGGGFSLFDTCIVVVDTNDFFDDELPLTNQGCQMKTRPSDNWRHMKIVSVNSPPGEGVIVMELNSFHESA